MVISWGILPIEGEALLGLCVTARLPVSDCFSDGVPIMNDGKVRSKTAVIGHDEMMSALADGDGDLAVNECHLSVSR